MRVLHFGEYLLCIFVTAGLSVHHGSVNNMHSLGLYSSHHFSGECHLSNSTNYLPMRKIT